MKLLEIHNHTNLLQILLHGILFSDSECSDSFSMSGGVIPIGISTLPSRRGGGGGCHAIAANNANTADTQPLIVGSSFRGGGGGGAVGPSAYHQAGLPDINIFSSKLVVKEENTLII